MSNFTPYEKLSRKKKRELDRQRRTVWGISPITRRPENPRAYKRKKQRLDQDDPASVSSISHFQNIVIAILGFFDLLFDTDTGFCRTYISFLPLHSWIFATRFSISDGHVRSASLP